jgi:hypothetical protein
VNHDDGHGTHESDVFVSYRRINRATADEIATHLRGTGFSTWVDRRRIQGGADWQRAIEAAIPRAAVFVALTTPGFRESKYCVEELDIACRYGKQIICVGESPATWPHPPALPAATVVTEADHDRLARLVRDRVQLGGEQARLESAAGDHRNGRSAYRGRRGRRAAQQTADRLRALGLPVSAPVTAFLEDLRRRRRRFGAVVAAGTVLMTFAAGTVVRQAAAEAGDQRADHRRERVERELATSRSEARQAARLLTGTDPAEVAEALRTAADAYDHAPTTEATAALREILAATGQADALLATKLTGPAAAVQFTPDGDLLAFTTGGDFTRVDPPTGRTTTSHVTSAPVGSAWLATSGSAVIALGLDRQLRYAPTSPHARDSVLGTGVDHAAASGDLRTYGVVHGAGVEFFGTPAVPGPARAPVRCSIVRPRPVTALALAPDGNVAAVGDQDGDAAVVDVSACRMSAVLPHLDARRLPIVSVDVTDGARAVSYTDSDPNAAAVVARRTSGGRYVADYALEVRDRFGPDAPGVDRKLPVTLNTTPRQALLGRTDGLWDVATAPPTDPVVFYSRMLPPPDGLRGDRHPLASTADGLAVTTTDTPWNKPLDVSVINGTGSAGAAWTRSSTAPLWSAGSRWLSAPGGHLLAVARATSVVVITPTGSGPAIATSGVAALSPSGRYLYDVSGDRIRRWRLKDRSAEPLPAVAVPDAADRSPVGAAAAVGENRLVVSRRDGSVRLVDAVSGAVLRRRAMTRQVTELAASPDGRWIVVVDLNGIHLLTADGLTVHSDRDLPGGFSGAFAPDSSRLAIRTSSDTYAFTLPVLQPVLREQMFGGNDTVAYGPAFPTSRVLALPTGSIRRVCDVCASGDGPQLRAAAARVLYAADLGWR